MAFIPSLQSGSEFRLSDPGETEVNFPKCARVDDDTIAGVWQSKVNASNVDVRFRTCDQNGVLGPRMSIDPDPAAKNNPLIVETGDVLQTCYSKRAPGSLFNVFVRRMPKVGMPLEPVYQASTDGSVDHSGCRILPFSQNSSLVIWYKHGTIQQVGGTFLNNGIPNGSELIFSGNPTLNYNFASGARISDTLFGIVMAQYIAPTWSLVYNTFRIDNGAATGPEISVASNPSISYVNPTLAGKNSSATLVYNAIHSSPRFYEVERREITGRTVGPAEQLNTMSTEINQRFPAAAVGRDGEELTLWENALTSGGFDVDGIFTHSNGTRESQEFRASLTNFTSNRRPAVTNLDVNKFGGFWVGSGNQSGVFARFFDLIAPGTPTTGTTATTALTTSGVATTALASTVGGASSSTTGGISSGTTVASVLSTAAGNVVSSGSSGSADSSGVVVAAVVAVVALCCIASGVCVLYRKRRSEPPLNISPPRPADVPGSAEGSVADDDVVVYDSVAAAVDGDSSSSASSSSDDADVEYGDLSQFQMQG
ncbi:MAG: hypothetical protein P0S96_02830 [Simkaniaceae bacterium]|nr:hypothetical protein [Candidatus Sacchlamyda saccharinae]